MFDLIRRGNGFFDDFFNIETKNYMKTDILENDDEYKFLIELPGFDKEDIKISIKNESLIVSVNKEEKSEEEKKAYIRKEIRRSSMSRNYHVGDVSIDALKANYEDGILTIAIPKEEINKKEETKYLHIK